MALNISILLMPWPVFFGALIVIITAIIVLTIVERVLHKKVILKKEEEDTYFLRRLGGVRTLQSNPQRFLSGINELAREFFDEEFKISGARYSELIERFKAGKNAEAIKFCEAMQETLYAGEKLTDERLNFLFGELGFLIRRQEEEKIKKIPVEKINAQIKPIAEEKKPFVEEKKISVEEKIVKQEPAKEQVKVAEVPKPTINMNLVKYLAEGRRRGFEMKLLRKNLLDAGFKDADVDRAITFFEARKEQPEQNVVEKKIDENAGKRILTQFFHPKNAELETIKKEVEDSESNVRPEVIEIVPYKKEKIKMEKKEYPKREPKSYQYIESTDNLDRLREKIRQMKQEMSSQGHKGAGL
jgi:hypothetical protein